MPSTVSNLTLKSSANSPLRSVALATLTPAVLRAASIASLMLVSYVALYWPTFALLVRNWLDLMTYSHGWLIGLVAIWLAIKAVPYLNSARRGGELVCALGLVGALCLWLIGYVTDMASPQYLSLPTIPWLLAGCVWGIRALRVLAIPYATLLLVMPIWDPLVAVLQPTAVTLVESTTRLIGLQVFVQGNEVMVPDGTFTVLDSCSGLRYVAAAAVVALLAGELGALSVGARIALVTGGLLMAVFLNHLRIVTIILVGYFQGLYHPLMKEHAFVGEIYFAVFAVVPMILIARAKARPTQPPPAVIAAGRASWPLIIAVASMIMTPIAARTWDAQRLEALTLDIQLPSSSTTWVATRQAVPWETRFGGAAAEAAARYESRAGAQLHLYVASFLAEDDRRELIGQESGLAEVVHDLGASSTGVEVLPTVNVAHINDRTGQLWRLWFWYQLGDQVIVDRRRAKLQKLKNWFERATPSSIVALATPCSPRCEDADESLAMFLATHGTSLAHAVTVVRDQEN